MIYYRLVTETPLFLQFYIFTIFALSAVKQKSSHVQ